MVKWIDSVNESLLKATDWTAKNFKAIAVVLTLLIVSGAVWAAITYKKESKNIAALTAFAPIERDFSSWKTPEQKTPEAKPDTKDAKDAKADAKTPEVVKVDPAQLFGRMMDSIKTQGNVPANELMALMASEVAATLGPQQEAELLEVSMKTFNSGAQLTDGLILMKNGDLLANQDKCDKALDQWKKVISNNRLGYLHDLVRLKSGLCFEKMAKFEDAEKYYDEIIKGSMKKNDAQKTAEMAKQNQWAVKEAQKLKRALKWSQKQPSS